MTLAKRGMQSPEKKLSALRLLRRRLSPQAVERLFSQEVLNRVKDREGGYTRILKLSARKNDKAPRVLFELCESPKAQEKKTAKDVKSEDVDDRKGKEEVKKDKKDEKDEKGMKKESSRKSKETPSPASEKKEAVQA